MAKVSAVVAAGPGRDRNKAKERKQGYRSSKSLLPEEDCT